MDSLAVSILGTTEGRIWAERLLTERFALAQTVMPRQRKIQHELTCTSRQWFLLAHGPTPQEERRCFWTHRPLVSRLAPAVSRFSVLWPIGCSATKRLSCQVSELISSGSFALVRKGRLFAFAREVQPSKFSMQLSRPGVVGSTQRRMRRDKPDRYADLDTLLRTGRSGKDPWLKGGKEVIAVKGTDSDQLWFIRRIVPGGTPMATVIPAPYA